MRVTVLGKSPSWQDAGGACSGYLVQHGDTTLLLDCGCGVFSKLRLFHDYVAVDAVVLSHLHADHFLDLVPYAYALRHGPRAQPGWAGPRLIAPSGAREVFRRVAGAWGSEELIEGAFAIEEYDGVQELDVGALRVRFRSVPHYVPTHAVEIAAGGARVTYGADSRPTDELVAFARGTDLLLVEATLPLPEDEGDRGHMTPGEAGDHGRRAGAHRLVLTHISDELDAAWAREEAARTFGAPVELAAEGAVYTV